MLAVLVGASTATGMLWAGERQAANAPMQERTRPRGGLAMNYIGIVRDKPFTARRVTESVTPPDDSVKPRYALIELVARDSAGRIRIQKEAYMPTAGAPDTVEYSTADGQTRTTTREELNTLILVFDHANGQSFQLEPGMQIAQTRPIPRVEPGGPGDRPYSTYFYSPARPYAEDLGTRDIAGMTAHGFRSTMVGTEQDGEWNGKPIRVWERWVSDDLAATLLETTKDLKSNKESKSTLTDIKRDEPDPSLFKIPPGYIVNPTKEQMPRVFVKGKPSPQP